MKRYKIIIISILISINIYSQDCIRTKSIDTLKIITPKINMSDTSIRLDYLNGWILFDKNVVIDYYNMEVNEIEKSNDEFGFNQEFINYAKKSIEYLIQNKNQIQFTYSMGFKIIDNETSYKIAESYFNTFILCKLIKDANFILIDRGEIKKKVYRIKIVNENTCDGSISISIKYLIDNSRNICSCIPEQDEIKFK